jgi:conjugal transfer pilus assembly protein TraB
MASSIRDRLAGVFDGMSPRARQWAMLGAIAAAAVGVLWAVFSMGEGEPARPVARAERADLKPTNVDLMAPGSQVKDVETWVGKAGRELEQYKNDREEQRRINRERQEAQEALMRRFTDLETRLKSAPGDPGRPGSPSAAPSAQASPPVPPAPGTATRYPPDAALARQPGLPPPPPPPALAGNRAAMPAGAPGQVTPFASDPLAQSAQPTLVRVTLARPTKGEDGTTQRPESSRQTLDTYLPVSFTRGVLLGGLDAPTGGQSQSNPHPVLIRLSDNSVLPNRYRAEYRECFVIAAGYGDISSERAYLRTESLSCVRSDGSALEVKIQGSVYGEDGKVGMRGRLITKQGQMLANALMAGVVSGIGQGIATSNTTYSTSALGAVATTSGSDALKAGLGAGVGKALDRLAQYYIKLAEQTFPIIEIDAGREIDVVLTKGVRIDGAETAKASPASLPHRAEPTERFVKASDDEE